MYESPRISVVAGVRELTLGGHGGKPKFDTCKWTGKEKGDNADNFIGYIFGYQECS